MIRKNIQDQAAKNGEGRKDIDWYKASHRPQNHYALNYVLAIGGRHSVLYPTYQLLKTHLSAQLNFIIQNIYK